VQQAGRAGLIKEKSSLWKKEVKQQHVEKMKKDNTLLKEEGQ
jgi:hypothetical protein